MVWRWLVGSGIPVVGWRKALDELVTALRHIALTQDARLLEEKQQTALLQLLVKQGEHSHKAVRLVATFGKPQKQEKLNQGGK